MTNKSTVSEYHRIISPLVGLALCMALMPSIKGADHATAAQSPFTTNIAEQFTGQQLSVSDAERAGRIQIIIAKWSSDDMVSLLSEPLRNADGESLMAMLHDQHPRIGVVLMPGVQVRGVRSLTPTPRNILFARDVMTPSGRQIIIIADEHLGLGEPPLEARKQVSEFNLIDIRFGPDGKGVAKVASAADIAFNPKTGIVEVKDFSKAPARVIDVQTQTQTQTLAQARQKP
jgi:hypothetical protein